MPMKNRERSGGRSLGSEALAVAITTRRRTPALLMAARMFRVPFAIGVPLTGLP